MLDFYSILYVCIYIYICSSDFLQTCLKFHKSHKNSTVGHSVKGLGRLLIPWHFYCGASSFDITCWCISVVPDDGHLWSLWRWGQAPRVSRLSTVASLIAERHRCWPCLSCPNCQSSLQLWALKVWEAASWTARLCVVKGVKWPTGLNVLHVCTCFHG